MNTLVDIETNFEPFECNVVRETTFRITLKYSRGGDKSIAVNDNIYTKCHII